MAEASSQTGKGKGLSWYPNGCQLPRRMAGRMGSTVPLSLLHKPIYQDHGRIFSTIASSSLKKLPSSSSSCCTELLFQHSTKALEKHAFSALQPPYHDLNPALSLLPQLNLEAECWSSIFIFVHGMALVCGFSRAMLLFPPRRSGPNIAFGEANTGCHDRAILPSKVKPVECVVQMMRTTLD